MLNSILFSYDNFLEISKTNLIRLKVVKEFLSLKGVFYKKK